MTPYQCRIRSTIALVSAYTLSGAIGASSATGITAGVPFTEQLDENTMSRTPAARIASTRSTVPPTLFTQYRSGCSIDSPTLLYAAKCTTCVTSRCLQRSVTSARSWMSPTTQLGTEERRLVAVLHRVEDDDVRALLAEHAHGVGADVAGAAGDEDGHGGVHSERCERGGCPPIDRRVYGGAAAGDRRSLHRRSPDG